MIVRVIQLKKKNCTGFSARKLKKNLVLTTQSVRTIKDEKKSIFDKNSCASVYFDIAMSDMSEINLPYVNINYKEPIVYFAYKEGTELGFPEIRELISCAEKLSSQKPYVTFSDVRVTMNITTEGKRVIEDLKNMPLFRGTAVLVNNNMYKFAANFMSYYNKPKYPFRAFTSKDDAINWLLTLPLDPQEPKPKP